MPCAHCRQAAGCWLPRQWWAVGTAATGWHPSGRQASRFARHPRCQVALRGPAQRSRRPWPRHQHCTHTRGSGGGGFKQHASYALLMPHRSRPRHGGAPWLQLCLAASVHAVDCTSANLTGGTNPAPTMGMVANDLVGSMLSACTAESSQEQRRFAQIILPKQPDKHGKPSIAPAVRTACAARTPHRFQWRSHPAQV